jgi:hypothetical protein
MSKDKKLRIRNSTAEFLIFTRQAGASMTQTRLATVQNKLHSAIHGRTAAEMRRKP